MIQLHFFFFNGKYKVNISYFYIFGPFGGLPLLPTDADNDRFEACCPCGVGRKAPDFRALQIIKIKNIDFSSEVYHIFVSNLRTYFE